MIEEDLTLATFYSTPFFNTIELMKSLLYTSLALLGIVILNEFAYLGQTSLAWVLMVLAIAIGLQGIYLIKQSD